ncbi:hypothetical protein GCM10027566_36940 [Arachidicoccus ginsenosidivorans]
MIPRTGVAYIAKSLPYLWTKIVIKQTGAKKNIQLVDYLGAENKYNTHFQHITILKNKT